MKIHMPEEACPVAEDKIQKVVEALNKVNELAPNDAQLEEEDNQYLLSITLHKVPATKNRTVLIKLPNPLFNRKSEICVFTHNKKDEDKETTESYWQSYFKERLGITPKTITLPSLNKDYQTYQQKRNLASSYAVFIADERIFFRLPEVLGKSFKSRNKMPVQMKMSGDKFCGKFDEVLSCTKWNVSGRGDNTTVQIGKAGQTTEELVANIQSVLSVVKKTVDRGWANVKNIQLKTERSISIPMYTNDEVSESLNQMSENEKKYVERCNQLQERREELFLKKKVKHDKPIDKNLKRKLKNKKNLAEKIQKTQEVAVEA